MILSNNLFRSQWWFWSFNLIEPVWRNSGKLWAGKYSRNLFLDFLGEISRKESWYGYSNILQPPENTIKVPLHPLTRFFYYLIHWNVNTIPQLIQNTRNYLHLERSIFVFKLIGKVPTQHSVPNQEHWLKWLSNFFNWTILTAMCHTKRGT